MLQCTNFSLMKFEKQSDNSEAVDDVTAE